jgi:outer membrane protein assembly factor BamB
MELRRGAFSLALLVGSVNAACVNLRPPPPPIAASAAGMAPTKVWTTRPGRRLTPPVEVSEGMLYGGSLDRKVYAVDLTSGDVRWSVRMPGMIVGGVVVSGDIVYVASSRPQGRVSALRRSNGKQIWRASAPPIGAPLAVIDSTLIALGERGEVLGLDPRTGKTRWQRRIGVARIAAVSAGSAEMLIAGIDSLYRVSVDSGEVIARAASPGTIVSPWLSRRGALIAGTTDSQVVSIDPEQLQLNWSLKLDAPVMGSPGAMGDTLFLASRSGSIYRIEPGPAPRSRVIASLHWPVTAPVTIAEREILLGGADGVIRALRPDGHEVWRVRVWRPVELGPVTFEDGLIAMGGNGDLHRYRQ